VETRKELQASMNRVNTTAAEWDAMAKVLDDRAAAIGAENAVQAGVGAAVAQTVETRVKETEMLGDLAQWLQRVSGLPRELMELEIDDVLEERLESMSSAAQTFEDGTGVMAKSLESTLGKYSALSAKARLAAKTAAAGAEEAVAAAKGHQATAVGLVEKVKGLEGELAQTKDRFSELLKNHKGFVASSKKGAEATAAETEHELMVRDKLIESLEGKLKTVEQLGRALVGDSQLQDDYDAALVEISKKDTEIYRLKGQIGDMVRGKVLPPPPSSPLFFWCLLFVLLFVALFCRNYFVLYG
jgi:hypothetical protein